MNILLFGRNNSITHTIHEMLDSAPGWIATKICDLDPDWTATIEYTAEEQDYNIVVANLSGFVQSPTIVVKQISETIPSIPLLVLHSYSQQVLIQPLIWSGADGYLQVGLGERKLFEGVKKVADGQKTIFTENT